MDIATIEHTIRDTLGARFTSFYEVRTVAYQIDGATKKLVNVSFVLFDGSVHVPSATHEWTLEDLAVIIHRIGLSPATFAFLPTSFQVAHGWQHWAGDRVKWVEQRLADLFAEKDKARDSIRAAKRQRRNGNTKTDAVTAPTAAAAASAPPTVPSTPVTAARPVLEDSDGSM